MYSAKLIFIILFTAIIANAQTVLKPHIGIHTLPADSDSICHIPLYLGSFNTSGLQAGDTAADFTLYDLNGNSLNLNDMLTATQKPVLLVAGSYTCPVFMNRIADINHVIANYGNQLNVAVIYTLEAHPDVDTSVYFGYVNTSQQNIQAGILYRQPRTYGERKAVLTDMLAAVNLQAPVYLDAPCNNWWHHYGPAPNNAYLIGVDGKVFSKHGWLNKYPQNIFCDIDSLLALSGNCNTGNPVNGTFTYTSISSDTVYAPSGSTFTAQGELYNNSQNDVLILVKRLTNNPAAGWETALCLDACYSTATDSVFLLLLPGRKQSFHFYFFAGAGIDTSYASVGFRNENNVNNRYRKDFTGITQEVSTHTASFATEYPLQVYPNPSSGLVNLISEKNALVTVYNTLGKPVLQQVVMEPNTLFNFSNFSKGIYFIHVSYQEQKNYAVKKILIE